MGTILEPISEAVAVVLSTLDHPNLAKQTARGCSQRGEKNRDQPAPEAMPAGVLPGECGGAPGLEALGGPESAEERRCSAPRLLGVAKAG